MPGGARQQAERDRPAPRLRGALISQSYRFPRMVLNVAVGEGLIARNPCQIPGAEVVHAAERPIATPAQVVELVEAINPRYRRWRPLDNRREGQRAPDDTDAGTLARNSRTR